MIRKIIKINEELCNGCGICAAACHEGAIGMADGKAKLLREDYCDGLGDCLPTCPTGAITFEEREAPAYDHEAVLANQKKQAEPAGGCPGSMARTIVREAAGAQGNGAGRRPGMQQTAGAGTPRPSSAQQAAGAGTPQISGAQQTAGAGTPQPSGAQRCPGSELRQWPVQIKLVPVTTPYFDGANLLIAADCTAFTYGNFHQDFIRNHIVLIGCPKLDDGDYSEKLTEIIARNDIKSVKIVRMEVPCCGGIEHAAKKAIQNSGKFIPWQVVTISVEGDILE